MRIGDGSLASDRIARYVLAMAEEPENLTLRLLNDLRDEVQQLRAEQREMRKDLTQRVNGITLMLSIVAGMTHDHEQRLEALESR